MDTNYERHSLQENNDIKYNRHKSKVLQANYLTHPCVHLNCHLHHNM